MENGLLQQKLRAAAAAAINCHLQAPKTRSARNLNVQKTSIDQLMVQNFNVFKIRHTSGIVADDRGLGFRHDASTACYPHMHTFI